jgi:protein-L-isoaspartate O-methyltransferase
MYTRPFGCRPSPVYRKDFYIMTIAEKLRDLADRLQKDINHARREMTQNPTPKRMREYRSRGHDADNWERGQRAMRCLAAAHDAGTVPDSLRTLTTKAAILPLVYKSTKGGGYYDVIPDDAYRDTTAAGRAMQAMIETTTPEQAAQDAERDKQEGIRRKIDALRFADIPGFFPTPAPLVALMIDRAHIEPGHVVLEPSAGIGSIADAIRTAWGNDVSLRCCELRPALQEILKAKGHTLTDRDDFLETPTYEIFDRILMNPPFENLQDVDHVQHAFDCLKPGGRLVAIMSASPFFNGRRKGEDFRQWLDDTGGKVYPLPDDAFKGVQAFRQTGVSTRLVVIDKPGLPMPAASMPTAAAAIPMTTPPRPMYPIRRPKN